MKKKLLALILSATMIIGGTANTFAACTSGTSTGNCTTTTTTTKSGNSVTTTTSTSDIYIYKAKTTTTSTTTSNYTEKTVTVKACYGTAVIDNAKKPVKVAYSSGKQCGCSGAKKYLYTVKVKIGGIIYNYQFNTYKKTCILVGVVNKGCKAYTVPKSLKWKGKSYSVNGVCKTAFKGCTKAESIKYYANTSTFTMYLRYCTRLDEILIKNSCVKKFTKESVYGCRKYLYFDLCTVTQYKYVYKLIASSRKDVTICYGGKYTRWGAGCGGNGSAQSSVGSSATAVSCGNYTAHKQCKCRCYCK